MKIYLDYVFLINFLFDFILLLGISIILKRNVSKKRIVIGSLFGAISFFVIFIKISSLLFLILKLIFGFLLVIITFSYKNITYTMHNFIALIILSIIIGGFLYLINIEVGYNHVGMMFFTNGKSVNFILLIVMSFLLTIFYSRYLIKQKRNIKNLYKVSFKYKNKVYRLNGYLDTGNNLMYKKRPVLIVNKNIIKEISEFRYIPFATVNSYGVMKGVCLNVVIDNILYKNIYICLSNDKFNLYGADIILNDNLEGGINLNERNNKKTFIKTKKKK